MAKVPVKRANDPREARRIRAWELHLNGWSQTKIAEHLGVTQGAVSQWLKRGREGGSEALRHHPAPGRKGFLSEQQFTQIPELIARGATAFGFEDDRWTVRRVTLLLQLVFEVSYHPGHVSRLLKKYCPNWRDGKQQ